MTASVKAKEEMPCEDEEEEAEVSVADPANSWSSTLFLLEVLSTEEDVRIVLAEDAISLNRRGASSAAVKGGEGGRDNERSFSSDTNGGAAPGGSACSPMKGSLTIV